MPNSSPKPREFELLKTDLDTYVYVPPRKQNPTLHKEPINIQTKFGSYLRRFELAARPNAGNRLRVVDTKIS